jgi:hypothetical protein
MVYVTGDVWLLPRDLSIAILKVARERLRCAKEIVCQ